MIVYGSDMPSIACGCVIQPLNMEANISAWLPPSSPPTPHPPTHPCRLQAGNPQEAFCCSFIRLLRNKGHTESPTQGWSKDPHPSIGWSLQPHMFFKDLHLFFVTFSVEIRYKIHNNNEIHRSILSTEAGTHITVPTVH